ncbi:MAG: hypothetical protein JKY03_02330 [Aureispira sp.]|nr:hypothetical protein [Aureispira sp.]
MENNLNNQGNNNIIIQGITDNNITLEVNGTTQEIQNEMTIFGNGAKVGFFSSKHISDASLNYRFLGNNGIKNVNFLNIFNENTKLEDLMKNKSNHIKLKFDLIFQQFEEAKKQTLKNSQQRESTDSVKIDDLFN